MAQFAIIHYGEIALKGGNRKHFEEMLVTNIKQKMGDKAIAVLRESGQFAVELDCTKEEAADILSRIPGIMYFSFATRCELDLDEIKRTALDYAKSQDFVTFKVNAKRRSKGNPFTSTQLNQEIGALICEELGKKAQMKGPDLMLKIEIANKYAYVSGNDIPGVGGIPIKSKQKVISLLSGGFDSPVAAFKIMKRGCEVVFVHFQNENQRMHEVEDKIQQLAKQLSKYQPHTKLYVVPFGDLQQQIIMKIKSDYRMLIYRKFMFAIAGLIARKEKADFLVTGDSLSQVASQTPSNLRSTYDESTYPVLAPLIGSDKVEVLDVARTIGTYEISEIPYGDCCSYFLPKHPVLSTTPGFLKRLMSEYDVDALAQKALDGARVHEY